MSTITPPASPARGGSGACALIALAWSPPRPPLALARPRRGGHLHGHPVQLGDAVRRGELGAQLRPLRARGALCGTDAGLQAFHDADATGLWHYGAWVWRAPAGTVFTGVQANASLTSQAGHRGELVATRPRGEPVGVRHRAHRLSRSLDRAASSPSSTAGCAASPRAPAALRARRRRLRPRLRARRLPAHRGPRRRRALAVTGGSLLDGEVDPRHPRARRSTRPTPAAASARSTSRATATAAGHRHPQLRGRRRLRDRAAAPCPPTTTESAAVPTAARGLRHRAREHGHAPASRTSPSTAPRTATCEPRQVWVDNACPASARRRRQPRSAPASATARRPRHRPLRPAGRGPRPRRRRRRAGSDGVRADPRSRRRRADRRRRDRDHRRRRLATRSSSRPGPSREVFVHHVVGDRVIARHGLALALGRRAPLCA